MSEQKGLTDAEIAWADGSIPAPTRARALPESSETDWVRDRAIRAEAELDFAKTTILGQSQQIAGLKTEIAGLRERLQKLLEAGQ